MKVHPDGTGALKKTAHKPSASRAEDGVPRFIWLPRIQLALELGFVPVVPPKSNRINTWEYNRAMYRQRNEIEERLFRRLKGFRRIFSRFEKLDVMFTGFIYFALIVEAFRSVNPTFAIRGLSGG